MKHDVICGWSKDPEGWLELAAAAPEPVSECSTCYSIKRVRKHIDAQLADYEHELSSARFKDIVQNCRILVMTS